MKTIKRILFLLLLLLSASFPVMAADGTKTTLYTIAAVLLVPLAAAFWITAAKVRQMKTARPDHYASNYIKDGSFHLDVSQDIYLFSTMRKTPRPKANRK